MKTKARFLVLVLVSVLAAPSMAQEARSIAEKIYTKFTRMMKRQDVKGVTNMLADNYTMTDPEGKVWDKETMSKEMAAMCKQMRNADGNFVLSEVYQNGNEIVCWVTMNATFDVKVDGKWQRQNYSEKFIETLAHTPEGWKFVSTFVQPK